MVVVWEGPGDGDDQHAVVPNSSSHASSHVPILARRLTCLLLVSAGCACCNAAVAAAAVALAANGLGGGRRFVVACCGWKMVLLSASYKDRFDYSLSPLTRAARLATCLARLILVLRVGAGEVGSVAGVECVSKESSPNTGYFHPLLPGLATGLAD